MLIKRLEKVKLKYDETQDFDLAIKEALGVLYDLNQHRYDVANAVFEDDEKFREAFAKAEWTPKLKKYYSDIKTDVNNLTVFSLIYSVIAFKGGYSAIESKVIVELAKDIFDKEIFKILEERSFEKFEILVRDMMKPVDYIPTVDLHKKHIRISFMNEIKDSPYEKECKEILEKVLDEF